MSDFTVIPAAEPLRLVELWEGEVYVYRVIGWRIMEDAEGDVIAKPITHSGNWLRGEEHWHDGTSVFALCGPTEVGEAERDVCQRSDAREARRQNLAAAKGGAA